MTEDNVPSFAFPAVCRKRAAAAFDGGRLTLAGGVMQLSVAEHRLGIARGLARCDLDVCDPARVTHSLAEIGLVAKLAGHKDAVVTLSRDTHVAMGGEDAMRALDNAFGRSA